MPLYEDEELVYVHQKELGAFLAHQWLLSLVLSMNNISYRINPLVLKICCPFVSISIIVRKFWITLNLVANIFTDIERLRLISSLQAIGVEVALPHSEYQSTTLV